MILCYYYSHFKDEGNQLRGEAELLGQGHRDSKWQSDTRKYLMSPKYHQLDDSRKVISLGHLSFLVCTVLGKPHKGHYGLASKPLISAE